MISFLHTVCVLRCGARLDYLNHAVLQANEQLKASGRATLAAGARGRGVGSDAGIPMEMGEDDEDGVGPLLADRLAVLQDKVAVLHFQIRIRDHILRLAATAGYGRSMVNEDLALKL